MEPRILSVKTLARVLIHPRAISSPILSRSSPILRPRHRIQPTAYSQLRRLTTTHCYQRPQGDNFEGYDNSNARPAVELDHNITQEEKDDFAKRLAEDKGKQILTPWHREGSNTPPVARQRSAGAMTKGKLLTTPSRMLKLVLPLTTQDTNSDRKDLEPLALLVHPQQPLSYLERLIQSELPPLKTKDGKEKIPAVYFRAEDSMQDELEASKPQETSVQDPDSDQKTQKEKDEDFEKADEIRINGKTEKTGKLHGMKKKDDDELQKGEEGIDARMNRRSPEEAAEMRGGHGEGGVESYSGLGQEAPADKQASRKFVRWSTSTEIGDFIRDAARGQEFAVEIEGAPHDIRVGVPSFNDRTYYLRMRLRKVSEKISDMADVKEECDRLAHKAAQRVALGGFGILLGWWGVVYKLTFGTDLGWDVMEPVTYLVGLSTLIGGYVWFLYHNREVSYRSAMNFTISRRQSKLYGERGFDLRKWGVLIEDGNALRKEIKAVASEYDVEWDELHDEKDEKVAEALKEHREKKKNGGKKDSDGDGDGGEKDQSKSD
ncbi:hypothetical protein K504DRAFT_458468 [Pleomassaria siparia CBS 279.74]|uniref:Calcium uniporter protein, mitochondrial n=1 Tax=Pleomassaria siparia CBS 279.74 TaxID=1314801 RepID=A0A6G1K2C3_9PLEO|nr:hypothetical protein K504DRAFT_458468 [Pleomassaria siparia CBS 279.74]